MPTPPYTVRIPDDLKQAVDKKAADERIRSFTDAVDAALNLWVGSDGSAALRKAADRAEEAEAARDEALAELAALRARAAGIAGVKAPRTAAADGASREDRLIAALASATEEMPATRRHLMTVSGYDGSVLGDRLAWLREHGYITQPAKGRYARVPGADIRKGLQAARDDAAGRQREARRTAQGNGSAPESSPAPRRPAAGRTAPSGTRPPVAAKPATAAAVVQAAREAGHDVTTASELPAPIPAVFQPIGGEREETWYAGEATGKAAKPGRVRPGGKAGAESASDIAAALRKRKNGGQR